MQSQHLYVTVAHEIENMSVSLEESCDEKVELLVVFD